MEEYQEKYMTGSFTAQEIRNIYDILFKYYDFDYSWIFTEIQHAVENSPNNEKYFYMLFDNETKQNRKDIDYLPDDFEIGFVFPIVYYNEFQALTSKYFFLNDGRIFDIFMLSSLYIKRRINEYEYFEDAGGDVEYDIIINGEKRKLYEFLLDNPHEFKESNRAKARMEIRYGLESKAVDNYNNWLYNLLKRALHQDLTFGGRFEYNLNEKPKKPTRAPSFSNFVAYNTYLLLKEVVGSKSKFPAEFSKFIIDFCELCEINLTGRHTEVIGMKEFLSNTSKNYQDNPIPVFLIRE